MLPKPCAQCLALQKTKQNKKEGKKRRKEGRKEGRKEEKEKENMAGLISLHKLNTFITEWSFHPKMGDFLRKQLYSRTKLHKLTNCTDIKEVRRLVTPTCVLLCSTKYKVCHKTQGEYVFLIILFAAMWLRRTRVCKVDFSFIQRQYRYQH